MSSLIDYRGIQIVSPDPTGDGGLAIQNDLKVLADRAPYSVWSNYLHPGPSDDNTSNFFPGSLWLMTSPTPPRLYICQSSATGAAVWLEVLLCAIATPITLEEGANVTVGTLVGSKIGTTDSEMLGFYGAHPITQRSGTAQAAVPTTAATNSSPYGFTTAAQANAIVTLLNELRAWAVAQGFIKGSA